jgi:hypothetical protein
MGISNVKQGISNAPLTAEDIEYFQLYMEDYDWKIRFEGDFAPGISRSHCFCLSM